LKQDQQERFFFMSRFESDAKNAKKEHNVFFSNAVPVRHGAHNCLAVIDQNAFRMHGWKQRR